MATTTEDVKRLREMTGAGMLDCKKALDETHGDFEKAKDILRKKGLAAVAKRADRSASQGIIVAQTGADGRTGALVELRCETDFVARTEEFEKAARKLVELAVAGKADAQEVETIVAELAAKCGEKVELGRQERLEIAAGHSGVIAAYIHHGSKVGVMVEVHSAKPTVSPELARLGRTLAMQIAVSKPRHLKREEVPATDVEREKAIFAEQAKASGKPANVVEKMITGKLEKYYGEICLLEQEFLISPESDAKKVSDYVAEMQKKIGEAVTVARYVRLEVGQA